MHTAPRKENSQRKKTGVPHPTNQPLLDSKAAVLNWTPRSVTTSPIHIQPATVDLLFAATDSQKSFSMFEGIQAKYDWVCNTVEYPSAEALVRDLDTQIIAPVPDMEARIAEKRTRNRAVRRTSE